ncbi:hypothetical protein FOCC_FOCC015885 [Frankliniella occidentalis]|nr:hypothetical protein FOCC_FOCC015885 [Frankliniella occidentalis]
MTLKWTQTSDEIEHGLSEDKWKAVDALLEDLGPARKATTDLQREDLTLGEFFAIWTGVVLKLEKRKRSSELAKALLEAMKTREKRVLYSDRRKGERYSPLFNYPSFNAALFLDPRFFSILSPEQVDDAKKYLISLWERMEAVKGPAEIPADTTLSSDSDGDDSDGEQDLFSKLLEAKNKERLRQSQGASDHRAGPAGRAAQRAALRAALDDYERSTSPLSRKASVFDYWAKRKLLCPELFELAMVVLSIPATQVSVERLFSALKFILRPQRHGLSAKLVNDVAFLQANRSVVKALVGKVLPQVTATTTSLSKKKHPSRGKSTRHSSESSETSELVDDVSTVSEGGG